MIPHTSGTTGMPKGVMLTHGNITWNVVNLMSVADFRGDDVTVAVTPFFRTGGTGVNVLPVLFKGGTVVVPEAGDPRRDSRPDWSDGTSRSDSGTRTCSSDHPVTALERRRPLQPSACSSPAAHRFPSTSSAPTWSEA